MIHTVMTRTQAPPPQARTSGFAFDFDAVRISVPDAVSRLKVQRGEVQAVNVRMIGDLPWYQIFLADGKRPRYVNAVDSTVDDSQDEVLAKAIAAKHLGQESPEKTSYLTSFTQEYGNIFRILPVYGFEKRDQAGTRAYVSTATGSVTMSTNDAKARESAIFSIFHKWMFIRDKDMRDGLLIAAMSGIMAVSALGILLFFVTRPRKRSHDQPLATGISRS